MSRHTPGMRRWLLTLEEENKMTTQPEALRLADELRYWRSPDKEAAAELRRLHEVNQELLEALRVAKAGEKLCEKVLKARAAINKAEGEQK